LILIKESIRFDEDGRGVFFCRRQGCGAKHKQKQKHRRDPSLPHARAVYRRIEKKAKWEREKRPALSAGVEVNRLEPAPCGVAWVASAMT
jgi:hypothetical protein